MGMNQKNSREYRLIYSREDAKGSHFQIFETDNIRPYSNVDKTLDKVFCICTVAETLYAYTEQDILEMLRLLIQNKQIQHVKDEKKVMFISEISNM
jgi:hypothetical protein